MKTLKTILEVGQYTLDELDETGRLLVQRAIEATAHSYAPYSDFHVGAALMLDDGQTIIGANQENAAFPVTLCAERAAVFNAQSNYPDKAIVAIAIAAKNKHGLVATPVSPCGSCRQVILEMEQRYQRDIRLYLYGTDGVIVVNSIKDLLPLCFVDASMR